MRQSPRAGKLLLLLAQLRPDCGSIGQWWGGPCVPYCTILCYTVLCTAPLYCTTVTGCCRCTAVEGASLLLRCGSSICTYVWCVVSQAAQCHAPHLTSHHHWICWIHVSILCLCSMLCVARQAGAYFWHPIVIYSTINGTGAGTVTSLYTANEVWFRYFVTSKNVQCNGLWHSFDACSTIIQCLNCLIFMWCLFKEPMNYDQSCKLWTASGLLTDYLIKRSFIPR